jgi:bisphosphoglycerate-independent phosphoglycerate mutase (AlkP superfamily)
MVLQDDVRLDHAMQDARFIQRMLLSTIDRVQQRNASLHLIGLLTEKALTVRSIIPGAVENG